MNKYYKTIDLFIQNHDIARNNANFIRSLPVLEHVVTGELMKDYLFDVIYKGLPVRIHHEEGWAYHHQTFKLSPYCIGLSAESIAFHGLQSNAKNERKAKPPKRLESLFMQCANLICLIAQEVSGATSLNDISTIAAGYLWYLETNNIKKYSDYELENIWQEFLYNVNLPFRSGNSPFSNITLDFGKPNSRLKTHPVTIAGKQLDKTYSDIPAEYYDRINIAFIKAMAKGDADGNPFTFPLITVNITEDFDRSNKAWRMLLKESEKFGGFYVQNYLKEPFEKDSIYKRKNPFIKPFDEGMIYSNCCFTGDMCVVDVETSSPVSFEELYRRYQNNERLPLVMSFDENNKRFRVSKINKVAITRYVKELCYVELDNGYVVKCTPDHLFLNARNEWKPAKDLKAGEILKWALIDYDDAYLYMTASGVNDKMIHRYIAEYKYNVELGLTRKYQVHHKNGIKDDNRIENLELLSASEHAKLHFDREFHSKKAKQQWTDESFRKLHSTKTKQQWQDPRFRSKVIASTKYKTLQTKIRKTARYIASKYNQPITEELWEKHRTDVYRYMPHYNVIVNNSHWFDALMEGQQQAGVVNHRVKSVKIVKLDKPIPVYDIEVDKYHNFLLYTGESKIVKKNYKYDTPRVCKISGVIVHNCRMTFNIDLVETVTGSNPFHSGAGVGGIGVYAINMNRLLFLAKKDFELLKHMLDYLLDVGAKALQRKRMWLKEHWEDLFPYLSFYQPNDKSLYNIFSVVGVHEGMINAGFEDGLFNNEAKEYAHKIAQYLYVKLEEFMHRDGVLYSLEYAPSENAACKMAEKDLAFAKQIEKYFKSDGNMILSKDRELDQLTKLVLRGW